MSPRDLAGALERLTTAAAKAGIDPAAARTAAAAADYAGQPLAATVSIDASSFRRAYNSYNVVGRLHGTRSGSGRKSVQGRKGLAESG